MSWDKMHEEYNNLPSRTCKYCGVPVDKRRCIVEEDCASNERFEVYLCLKKMCWDKAFEEKRVWSKGLKQGKV